MSPTKSKTSAVASMLLLSIAALTGCSTSDSSSEDSSAEAAPTSTTTSECHIKADDPDSAVKKEGDYLVTEIVDGDTFRATRNQADCSDGPEVTVRLLGINAPEVAHGTNGTNECGGEYAKAALASQLPTENHDAQVRLVPDANSEATDKYDRILAYAEQVAPDLSWDGLDVGGKLVKQGFAAPWKPASAKTPERYAQYEKDWEAAKAKNLGNTGGCPIAQLESQG